MPPRPRKPKPEPAVRIPHTLFVALAQSVLANRIRLIVGQLGYTSLSRLCSDWKEMFGDVISTGTMSRILKAAGIRFERITRMNFASPHNPSAPVRPAVLSDEGTDRLLEAVNNSEPTIVPEPGTPAHLLAQLENPDALPPLDPSNAQPLNRTVPTRDDPGPVTHIPSFNAR